MIDYYMNVNTPLPLLFQVIYLLVCIKIDGFVPSIRIDFDNILFVLNNKMESLMLREAYSKIIRASDDVSRHFARIQYLEQRCFLRGVL